MKKPTKILITILLVLVLILAAMIAVPYFAFGIDIFDKSGWATNESGDPQYLDYYGEPLLEWQLIEDEWYYFDTEDGAMVTGWLEQDGERYYLDDDGTRQLGWVELADGSYYLDPSDAAAATGWLALENGTYYMDETGRMMTGWADVDEERYYLDDTGLLTTGWVEVDGNRYYLSDTGAMVTGWLETENGRCYLGEDGALGSGWTDTDEGRFYLTEDGYIATGWIESDEGTLYLDENGQPYSGWLETDDNRYYLNETGLVTTGWLETDDNRYYFHEDGTMAVGKVIIDDTANYFTSTGAYVVLVNSWNPVPDDYETGLVEYKGWKVSEDCYDSLVEMFNDLNSVGYYEITSAYRSVATQQAIWDRRMNNYLASGYSKEAAYTAVSQSVAIPGTSEHHLGLAVDISAGTNVHSWLAENSWRYGFIMRYPDGKTAITGIIYEPWHYRYVGDELAKEIYESGLTMEEYMDMLTEKAGSGTGTASNPELYG